MYGFTYMLTYVQLLQSCKIDGGGPYPAVYVQSRHGQPLQIWEMKSSEVHLTVLPVIINGNRGNKI